MSNELRSKLEQLKIDYIEITDDLNIQKAGGSLSKLMNLRTAFDETFDSFFDNKKIASKYGDWGKDEDQRKFDLSNTDIEEKLDGKDLQALITFYENYLGELEDELREYLPNTFDYTFSEACRLWSLSESTLRKANHDKRFLENDIMKRGRDWYVTEAAMERLYGDKKN